MTDLLATIATSAILLGLVFVIVDYILLRAFIRRNNGYHEVGISCQEWYGGGGDHCEDGGKDRHD